MTTNDFAEHAARSARSLSGDPQLSDVELIIEQRIIDDDRVIAQYHLVLGDGEVVVVDGPAPDPDVTISQDPETALALRAGTVHAQSAFLTGRLTVDGDMHKLLAHAELLGHLAGGLRVDDA